MRKLFQVLGGLIGLALLLPLSGKGHCQQQPGPVERPVRPRLGQNTPRANPPNPGRLAPDKDVMELLRKMVRPTVEYEGTQETVLYGATTQTSEQTIRGDSKGHVRIDFLSPPNVTGDVMLIAPGVFHNYHKSRNLDEMASWPTEWNDQEKRMLEAIRQGVVTVRKTGEEQIAGRSAVIVEFSLRANGVVERKFWIDPETGIQLKIEKHNLRGILISQTTMKSLVIGPEARVLPQDFEAKFPGASRTPLFPAGSAPFRTVAEAQGRLLFHALEPANLPAGFQLDGVWIFGGDGNPKQRTLLMRYTDGVATFSLFERLAPLKTPEIPLPRSFRNNLQSWLKGSPDGTIHIQFIGHLTAEQAEAIFNSLH